jgi:hypothetical protein
MKLFKLFVTVFLLFNGAANFAQNYSYQKELKNRETRRNLQRLLREQRLDSLEIEFKKFDNYLGFFFFQCKAIILAKNKDTLNKCYLDTAFMRGLTPLCLGKNKELFDSIQVQSSFQSNYLRAYNLTLINRIDSMHYKDQEYRQKAAELMRLNEEEKNRQAQSQKGMEENTIKLSKYSNQPLIDSLWRLQRRTDSTNMILLNQLIEVYGWPSAKLIGHYYCQRPAADVSILIMHLGTREREYQISTLKSVIELCEKNEESWGTAESLIFNLHSRFRNDYSEFSFIEVNNGKLKSDASFFSLYSMASLLITSPNYRIEIKCKNETLFNEIKSQMILMNESFPWVDYQRSTRPIRPLSESVFLFTQNPEMNQNSVQYKFILSNH